MKKLPLLLFLLILACISGYLMSKPSLAGRIGMDLFYKEYKFLKTWWQGALLVYFIWIFFWIVQGLVQKKLPRPGTFIIHSILIVIALAGLFFTWNDFHQTTTHRWLKERFHIGAYLFWVGWIMISISYLVQKKIQPDPQ